MHRFDIALRAASAALLLIAVSAAAAAQPYQALPVDDAVDHPALAALRDQLRDAVAARDTDAVVALAHPDIHLSYGGAHGRETLRAWLDGVDDMPWTGEGYWQALEAALALGGLVTDYGDGHVSFCAPYTMIADYPADLDPFNTMVVIRDAAPLRDAAADDARIVATLDHAIVEVIQVEPAFDPDDPHAPYWVQVRTADGRHEGYLWSADARSPVDYRACFGQDPDSGAWSWDQFIAGD